MVRLSAVLLLIATIASAHQEADVRMSFDVPQFVPIAQTFRYRIIADDLTNDEGADVLVTIVLPPQVRVANVVPNDTWSCSESNLTIVCHADEIESGPNPIDIDVIAPAQTGPLHATASVQTTGSIDLNPTNDRASSEVFAFDPSACTAAPPQLVAPADQDSVSPIVALTWQEVAGALSYTVFTSVEGAGAAPVMTVSTNAASLIAEPGTSEWWVVASFATCPPLSSAHRRFTATSTLSRSVHRYASGFQSPFGLALSPEGDLYVSDEAENVVRKITSGSVTNIAGIAGQPGSADGQFAQFNGPRGLAVTPLDGYLYAADTLNHEIRILYTGGPFVPSYDAGGAAGLAGAVDGRRDQARFNAPSGIAATERGSLYVADTANNRIRKMTPVADFIGYFDITTVGTGFHAPLGVAVGANGDVYVADTGDGSIRRLDGSVIAAGFDHPVGIAADTLGNLLITDRRGAYRIAPSGLVTTMAAGFVSPAGIVADSSGRIFVADSGAHAVYVIDRPVARRHVVR